MLQECGLSSSLNISYYTLPPFHVKKVLHSFSLASLSYQHHYSSALGTLLTKTRLTWTQALGYCDRRSGNPDGNSVTNRQGAEQHGCIGQRGNSRPGRTARKANDCIMLIRIVHNLKLINYSFVGFFI